MEQDPPVASSSEEKPEKQVVKLEDVLNHYLQAQNNLAQVLIELFKRTERSEEFVNTVKRLRTD